MYVCMYNILCIQQIGKTKSSEVWENYVKNSFTFSPYSVRKSSSNYFDLFIILSPGSPQFYSSISMTLFV